MHPQTIKLELHNMTKVIGESSFSFCGFLIDFKLFNLLLQQSLAVFGVWVVRFVWVVGFGVWVVKKIISNFLTPSFSLEKC